MAKKKIDPIAIRGIVARVAAEPPKRKTALHGSEQSVILGLQVPFAMEVLLDCNVLPFGVVIEIAGMPGSNKSSLAYEVIRWFYEAGGLSNLFITEGKDSPSLAESICGYRDEWKDGFAYQTYFPESMTEWQVMLADEVNKMKTLFKKGNASIGYPALFANTPIAYVVDSVMGQLLEKSAAGIEKEGASAHGYALEAGSLTKFAKVLQKMVAPEPMLALMVNHLKPDGVPEAYKKQEYKSPGGQQLKFQYSYRLQLERAGAFREVDTVRKAGFIRGHTIKMSLLKSSLGDQERSIRVPLRWWYDDPKPGEDRARQRTVFDWNAAIVSSLLAEPARAGNVQRDQAVIQEKIDDIVHFRALTKDKFYSTTFDIPKTAPVSAGVLGGMIQGSPEILIRLRQYYGIKLYYPWDCETNFYAVRKKLRAEAAKTAYVVNE